MWWKCQPVPRMLSASKNLHEKLCEASVDVSLDKCVFTLSPGLKYHRSEEAESFTADTVQQADNSSQSGGGQTPISWAPTTLCDVDKDCKRYRSESINPSLSTKRQSYIETETC